LSHDKSFLQFEEYLNITQFWHLGTQKYAL
jgi:hypothetical protein